MAGRTDSVLPQKKSVEAEFQWKSEIFNRRESKPRPSVLMPYQLDCFQNSILLKLYLNIIFADNMFSRRKHTMTSKVSLYIRLNTSTL